MAFSNFAQNFGKNFSKLFDVIDGCTPELKYIPLSGVDVNSLSKVVVSVKSCARDNIIV